MSSYTESREPPCTRRSTWVREYRDLQANAMSVNWSGSYILLAGRRHLALQSLKSYDLTKRDEENQDEGLLKFHRNSKYEVSSAEWAICQHSQEYCAIATSQLIEVVTWRSGEPTLKHSLRAHTRVITDIDWHCKIPHLLASCSIDTFTHLWDLRDPRKPVLSLSAVCMSGATQVGFNRVSGNLIATAHDGDLRIWDQRKGSSPIQYITAHLARIHGINWSHEHETHLATASQDGTVKYFDINNPRRAEKIITTPSPVWRARYTPFADGLVTIVVPHLGRGENSICMWNNSKQNEPICSFVGHTDVVLDFAWRPGSDRELITWSRDQTLRIWNIDEEIIKLCSKDQIEDDDGLLIEENLPQPSVSLQHEFSLLHPYIPHIDVEVLDPIKRNAMVRISANGYVIMLKVIFPLQYPNNGVSPEFIYCQGTSLNENLSSILMKTLKMTANQRLKKGRTCLEQCLRALVTQLKKSTSGGDDKGHLRLQSPRLEGALSSALHDACVPFPKTSGARFNQVGILVTFSKPLNTKRISLKMHNTTPRALSALSGGYLGNVMGSQPILYAHRDPSSSKSSRHRGSSHKFCASPVNVYDISKYLFVNKELAEKYIINNTNVPEMCAHNRKVAEDFGRSDLVTCWSLAGMIAEPNADFDVDDDMLSSQNPYAKNLIESLIMHFAQIHDIQTAAMLCCAFGRHCQVNDISRSSSTSSKSNQSHLFSGLRISKPSGSPYHTILPVDPSSSTHLSLAQQLKHLRSNSWSESLDDFRLAGSFGHGDSKSRSLLGDTNRTLYDNFKLAYAEMLYRWGMLVQRTKVLKYLGHYTEFPKCVEFVTECLICNRITKGPSCLTCRKPLLYCMLCRLPVRGASNACLNCGHGGHTEHMKKWFEKYDVCATGCGCQCIIKSSALCNL